jgi:hypothetical protein
MPLDIPALLDWANKVNTPEIQAMLQQYPITHQLVAEEIDQMRDRINWVLENFPAEFDPATADLADFLNGSPDPFVRESGLPTDFDLNFWGQLSNGSSFIILIRGGNAQTTGTVSFGGVYGALLMTRITSPTTLGSYARRYISQSAVSTSQAKFVTETTFFISCFVTFKSG